MQDSASQTALNGRATPRQLTFRLSNASLNDIGGLVVREGGDSRTADWRLTGILNCNDADDLTLGYDTVCHKPACSKRTHSNTCRDQSDR